VGDYELADIRNNPATIVELVLAFFIMRALHNL
jgi:hypothetical protein